MIVIIDNYDSFVFNISRYFRELGEETIVIRNDRIDLGGVMELRPTALIVSPGPATPQLAGISLAAIRELSGQVPILGICLGHQCIGEVFGARVGRALEPLHGQSSDVHHDGRGLFEGLPNPLRAGRYHSLIVTVDNPALSKLEITARSQNGETMALAHRRELTYGVQFHPESILTEHGHDLLANFLRIAKGR